MSQQFEGKSIDDALTSATAALGVERHQLTYHVLLEKRGFLGGVKRVVIEAEINVAAPAPEPELVAAPQRSSPPARVPQGGGAGGGGRQRSGRGRGGDRGSSNRGGGGGRGNRGGHRRSESDFKSGDFEQFAFEETPTPVQGPESEGARTVRAWLEEVLDIAKMHLDVRTEENDAQILIGLYGRDSRRLLEDHGELLDALQVLANKSLTGRKVEKDIELDSQRFKARRNEDLSQQARDLADRVRRDGREQLLPAMTPIERRIIHLALEEDADVTTESRGEGFYKRVAVIRRPAAPDHEQTATES
ncbi:MAG: R3H domain-containing nucleic acid-binding protein [Acidobacteriota bacterium]